MHDAFVTKLNPAGSALVYSTYLGGSWSRCCPRHCGGLGGQCLCGGVYILSRLPHPESIAAGAQGPEDGEDAFVTKLNPTGSALVYSTYLGGSEWDFATAAALRWTRPGMPM